MAQNEIETNSKETWWHALLCNIFGLAFILLPLAVFAALLDYHPEDPSFNKVTSGGAEVKNFLGIFGAVSADFVFSSFGLALILFLFIPIIWGVVLLRRHSFWEYKTRIFAWFVGVLCTACFIDLTCRSFFGRFDLPYNLIGGWSRSLSSPLGSHINSMNVPYYTIMIKGMLLFICFLTFNFAAGITFKFWWNLVTTLWHLLLGICRLLFGRFKKIANIRSFNEFKELNPSYLQAKMQNKLATLNPRREPQFERKEPTVNQILKTTTSMPNLAENQTLQRGPEIIMPQPNKTAVETPKKQTVSPTFEFIENTPETPKKTTRKIMPEEIYHTEGMKTAAAVRQQPAVQEELLTVPSESTQPETLTPKPQQAAKVITPKVEKAPLEAPKNDVYTLPSIDLLSVPKTTGNIQIDEDTLKENAAKLEQVLNDFGIRGQIVAVRPGPVVTLYELEPKAGTRTARVIGLSDDIARSMAVPSVRMAVVSGHSTIGIELPNEKRQTVWIRELFEDSEFKNSKNILNVALGKDIGGQNVYADISKMPHLLVAGTTGSGKSVGVNTMILSLLYRMTPEQCKFIMIDPKQLEFSMYNDIPHLLTPVITDPAKAVVGLKWAVQEMEKRYRQMALMNVRNIAGYNKKTEEMRKSGKEMKKTIQTGFDRDTGQPIYEEQVIDTSPMPYIVIVVDEMADLMLVAGKEVEGAIQRLAQMARAAGIHLIMSTQRPSVDVITGVIKSNFPSRISFHVTTKIDSGTILGEKGAEQLLGMGDMLFMSSGLRPVRVHGCYVADDEVERVVEYIKSQGKPQYVSEVTAGELNTVKDTPVADRGAFGAANDDEALYQQAVEIVRTDKKASTSYVQRKLRIGYNRAAELIERMEQEGIVSKQNLSGRREVIGED
ncbi:MAG: DNA translocase FtsK 4TM domain-containing protein [Alphaproteobacteria bacterium]|nr:DNA translocase FtsK 4TM domain-containing protein [Alphaproteobacteria bacterium]